MTHHHLHEGPEPCHYDRDRGERVTRRHRDDCESPATHRGCAPCTAPHCVVCGREHLDNAHPVTCEPCVIAICGDLDEILTADALLAIQAVEAGCDGRLVAAAPIPGGDAAVLRGPSVRLDALRVAKGMAPAVLAEYHHKRDPIPPLAVLAQWEDMWRQWRKHPLPQHRATLPRAIAYLRDQVPAMAQQTGGGPDWLKFTRQLQRLRTRLEHQLHDEREPEHGVECFECGDTLVRRFRVAALCQHPTPARLVLGFWLGLDYPEAIAPADVRQARMPCGACSQGGLDDPAAGQSWECQGCRKAYDSGAYATAVRRDLLDADAGDGWTHVTMAAEAATTLTGHLVPASTVRKWMDRGKVAALCVWRCKQDPTDGTLAPVPWGMRLVFWPDVADAAVEAVRRMLELDQERKRRAAQYVAWSEAVDAGENPKVAGERMELHPQRVKYFIEERDRVLTPQAG